MKMRDALFLRQDVIEVLRKEIGKTNQKAWAKANGVSASYVNDVLQGHRAPGFKVLAALGFKALEFYAKDQNHE